jgi:transcriptional regulator with XRE-family HTH domain
MGKRKKDYVKDRDYNAPLPTRLRKVMKARGETRIKLAEATGISRQSVGYYVTGESAPNTEKLALIAEHYGISVDWLLGLSDIPSKRREDLQNAIREYLKAEHELEKKRETMLKCVGQCAGLDILGGRNVL